MTAEAPAQRASDSAPHPAQLEDPFGRRHYDSLNDPVTRLERVAKVIQMVGLPVVLAIVLTGVLIWDVRRTNAAILASLDRLTYYQQQACINSAGENTAALARCNAQQQPSR